MLVLLAYAAAPAAAPAIERTYKLRSAPMKFGAFETKFPSRIVPTPRRNGFIVRMSTRLVDKRGRPISIKRLMLHHVVFIHSGPRAGARHNTCPGRSGEPFFGTGEEHQRLILPPGYGYPVREHDRWQTVAMYMSHTSRPLTAYLEYSVRISDDSDLVPVKPLWLRASGCDPLSSYTVPGGGAPGSADLRSHDWTIQTSGRIVAAGAHLHGGALRLAVSQPRCDDRTLLDHRPLWGQPDDPVYRVRPVLHEPGPIATGYFLSPTGIPVRRGEVLRVTGSYDAELPHPRVMAITPTTSCRRMPPPRAVDSPYTRRGGRHSQTFTEPGRYNLFCDLHPVTMHQTVTVRP